MRTFVESLRADYQDPHPRIRLEELEDLLHSGRISKEEFEWIVAST